MSAPLSVLIISCDPWWARMASALAEHAGHRTSTTDDDPARIARLLRWECPDAVLALIECDSPEFPRALADRCRRAAIALVLAARDAGDPVARESFADTPLRDAEIVDAWADPASIVRAVERAAGERQHAAALEGPGAPVANLRF